jgi:hypothetical protein
MLRALRTVLALLALGAGTASAFIPVSGLWLNPNEAYAPGRGFTIAVQDETLLMTSYIYSTTGAAEWYVLSGEYKYEVVDFKPVGRIVTGSLDRFRDGACFDCVYKRATYVGSAGNATLRFSSPTKGTITWPDGSTLSIVPFDFGYGPAPGGLLGEWVVIYKNVAGSDVVDRYGLTDLLPATQNGTGVAWDWVKNMRCEYQASGPSVGSIVCLDMDSTGQKLEKQFVFDQWFADRMEGFFVGGPGSTQIDATAFRTISRSDRSTGVKPADIPVSGLWLNPVEATAPGRGFTIAVQDRTLLMTSYIYDEDESGDPEWYVLTGQLSTSSTGIVSATGSLDKFRNGACFNCPYKPATYVGSAGTASVRFTSATNGVIVWPGGKTLAIVPFDFGYGAAPEGLEGEWAVVKEPPSGVPGATDTVHWFDLYGHSLATGEAYGANQSCKQDAAGVVTCKDTATNNTFRFEKWWGDQMEGFHVTATASTPARAFRMSSKSGVSTGMK